MNREQIYSALFAKFSTIADFKVKSRRIKHIDDMKAPEFPALFMLQRSETPIQEKKLLTKWQLGVDFYVYVKTGGSNLEVPASIINPILDKFEEALRPHPVTQQIALGLPNVSHAWISGPIEIYAGELGDHGTAIIPVEVLVVS